VRLSFSLIKASIWANASGLIPGSSCAALALRFEIQAVLVMAIALQRKKTKVIRNLRRFRERLGVLWRGVLELVLCMTGSFVGFGRSKMAYWVQGAAVEAKEVRVSWLLLQLQA
jgi:hypothetical protein